MRQCSRDLRARARSHCPARVLPPLPSRTRARTPLAQASLTLPFPNPHPHAGPKPKPPIILDCAADLFPAPHFVFNRDRAVLAGKSLGCGTVGSRTHFDITQLCWKNSKCKAVTYYVRKTTQAWSYCLRDAAGPLVAPPVDWDDDTLCQGTFTITGELLCINP